MILEIKTDSVVEILGGIVPGEQGGYAHERHGMIVKLHLTDHQVQLLVDCLCEAYGEPKIRAWVDGGNVTYDR